MLSELTSVAHVEDVKKDDEEELLLKEKASTSTGLLAVHIFGCTNLYLDKEIIPDHFGLYVNTTIGISSKSTSVKFCHKKGSVIWDEIKNFSIPISNKISSVLNKVCIAVIGFDKQHVKPKYRVLGKIEFHLHKMVKKQWSMDSFELQNKKKRYVGDISIEFAFAYGTFGYGLSNQIENIHSPREMVDQSAFPRIEPPNTTLNVLGLSCIPRKVTHPKFIPFITKVLDLEPDISPTYGMKAFSQNIFKTHQKLTQKMTRLKQVCGEYSLLGNRKKRISYLKKMMSEKETKHSTFNQIVEQDSDTDSSDDGALHTDKGRAMGLSGVLAQMANITFLASAPGIMQRVGVRPSLVPSDDDVVVEEDVQEDSVESDQTKSENSVQGGLLLETGGTHGLLEHIQSPSQRSLSKLQTQTGKKEVSGEDAMDTQKVAEVPEVLVLAHPRDRRKAMQIENLEDHFSLGPQTAGVKGHINNDCRLLNDSTHLDKDDAENT